LPTSAVAALQTNDAASSSSSLSSVEAVSRPERARAFDFWCRENKIAIHPAISHAVFPGGVRGLLWKRGSENEENLLPRKEPVLRIPSGLVLSSDMSSSRQTKIGTSWDVDLACALWNEILLQDASSLSGYCQWLQMTPSAATTDTTPTTSNYDECPTSAAPNALRRWTVEQKSQLAVEPAGQALLRLGQQQDASWRKKYQQLMNQTNFKIGMTFDQFEWAMEVVHSRAYCGLGGGGDTQSIISISAFVLAAAAGFVRLTSGSSATNGFLDSHDMVWLVALAVLAVLPAILLRPNKSAVLLPVIDSANHCQTADSSIQYDPIRKTYDLSIGSSCIVQHQLFVCYGTKGDPDLLLNYGFLPDVEMDEADTVDEQRRRLARAFLARNK
jgi:hypothetical protein